MLILLILYVSYFQFICLFRWYLAFSLTELPYYITAPITITSPGYPNLYDERQEIIWMATSPNKDKPLSRGHWMRRTSSTSPSAAYVQKSRKIKFTTASSTTASLTPLTLSCELNTKHTSTTTRPKPLTSSLNVCKLTSKSVYHRERYLKKNLT